MHSACKYCEIWREWTRNRKNGHNIAREKISKSAWPAAFIVNKIQSSVALYDELSYNKGMKVTALIPDKLVADVKELAQGENLTDSLIKALTQWANLEKIKKLNAIIAKKPLKFIKGFTAEKVRALNRKIT